MMSCLICPHALRNEETKWKISNEEDEEEPDTNQ